MEKDTMETANAGQEAQQPLLRVFLFGEFRLVWQVTPFTQDALWNSRTSARTLFKLLLCAPGRQASRSQLAGSLWPETDEGKARESLRQARNVLRKMLRTAGGEELLEQRNQGELLKLTEQARLWVDADAFEEYIAQASRVAAEDEALYLWQQAQALLSGEFLADDQSAEWTRHRWVRQRRHLLHLSRGRMVRHLADLYLQRGQTSLAEEVLEHFLVRFPTDQDTLYRLLLLLEQQGGLEEARRLYERSIRTLEALGKQPSPQVQHIYARLQQANASPDRLDQPSASPVVSSGVWVGWPVTAGGGQILSRQASVKQEHEEASDVSWDFLQVLGEPEQEGSVNGSRLSRRQILELGIAALLSRLARLDDRRVSGIEREVLSRALSESILDGWQQLYSLENAQVVALGRTQLALIHHAHALLAPATLAYLYAGAYSFLGLGLHFQMRDEEALQAYHQGHVASLATGDPWYVAQSLICQADSYHALGQYNLAIQTIEGALRLLASASAEDDRMMRTRAHLLCCWADYAMMLHDERTTQAKLDLAEATLDPDEANEEFDRGAWLLIAGKYALRQRKPEVARVRFAEALSLLPGEWLLRRVMTGPGLAMATARLGERDASLGLAKDLLPMISTTNAPITTRWYADYLQRDLLNAFPADTDIQLFVAEASRQLPPPSPLLHPGS